MNSVLPTLRWAFRSWLRAPFLAATAVATLALGVGVSTAVYSMVSGALLNVAPWTGADRAIVLEPRRLAESPNGLPTALAVYRDWADQSRAFEGLAALQFAAFNLTDGDDGGIAVPGRRVSANSFQLLGVAVQLGRGFVAADGEVGAPPVTVLSHGLWERRYAADPAIIGKTIEVDSTPTTVVGILRAKEFFFTPGDEMVMPLVMDPANTSRTERSLLVVGVLEPGVELEQARNDMALVADRLAAQYPATDAGVSVEVSWLSDRFAGGDRARTSLILLLYSVLFVLLIVCANVANLLLTRSAARVKEMATRAAVGASRVQLGLQLLVESAVLALLSFPLAMLFASLVRDFFLGSVPPYMGWMALVLRLDGPVITFAVVTSLATVLLVGLVPALQASRVDLQRVLKEGGGRGASSARPWVRQALAVAQLGLAISLLSVSWLMIESFERTQARDPGFAVERVLVSGIQLPEARYPTDESWREFERRLLVELERVPGAEGVASVDFPPYGFPGPRASFSIDGQVSASDREQPSGLLHTVSPDYVRTLGLELRRGRDLSAADDAAAVPVALVNLTLADRYFPEGRVLGERISVGGVSREIVGVISDYPNRSLRDPTDPLILIPSAQRAHRNLGVVLRTRDEPLSLAPGVRAAFRTLDAQLPVPETMAMAQRMDDQLWAARLVGNVMWILSQVALLLAAMGVYAVISYATAQRSQEFAIRAALGAEPGQVALLVLRQATWLACFGILLALGLSLLLAPLLERILYTGTGWSMTQFGLVAGVLTSVALVAAGAPAWRAMRADPMHALRAE